RASLVRQGLPRRPSALPPTPASMWSMAACNSTAATAICATIRSSVCCATCACTRFWKAPTRSCGSSSAARCSATDRAMADTDILFERRGAAGLVTLSRPKALNAVTHAMAIALREQLDAWAEDAAVTRVIVVAAGGRAFSAGGDIRALYDLGQTCKHDEALQFWRDEYPLNVVIKNYRKPYISLID